MEKDNLFIYAAINLLKAILEEFFNSLNNKLAKHAYRIFQAKQTALKILKLLPLKVVSKTTRCMILHKYAHFAVAISKPVIVLASSPLEILAHCSSS